MKLYVITNLIQNHDIGAEITIVDIKKTKKEAKQSLKEALNTVKKDYEKKDFKYSIEKFEDAFLIQNFSYDENITLQYIEKEV